MFIGRLPANSTNDAQVLVERLISYEQQPSPDQAWRERLLFVADNADTAGDFAALSDVVADGYVFPPYHAEKIYDGKGITVTHTTTESAQAAVLA